MKKSAQEGQGVKICEEAEATGCGNVTQQKLFRVQQDFSMDTCLLL